MALRAFHAAGARTARWWSILLRSGANGTGDKLFGRTFRLRQKALVHEAHDGVGRQVRDQRIERVHAARVRNLDRYDGDVSEHHHDAAADRIEQRIDLAHRRAGREPELDPGADERARALAAEFRAGRATLVVEVVDRVQRQHVRRALQQHSRRVRRTAVEGAVDRRDQLIDGDASRCGRHRSWDTGWRGRPERHVDADDQLVDHQRAVPVAVADAHLFRPHVHRHADNIAPAARSAKRRQRRNAGVGCPASFCFNLPAAAEGLAHRSHQVADL